MSKILSNKITIDIIGQGNVGTHLCKAFHGICNVNSVNSRTLENLRFNSDLYLICVKDTAIQDVASCIKNRLNSDAVVTHTSGSSSIDILAGTFKNCGVFYPLQTFTKDDIIDYSEIPFFIEGSNEDITNRLISLASTISNRVIEADSVQREYIHIASILSCNFVNHLWSLSSKYLKDKNLDFEYLKPLIRKTVEKIDKMTPQKAQTGPASRGDKIVLERHISQLENNPELQTIYKILSKSIEDERCEL